MSLQQSRPIIIESSDGMEQIKLQSSFNAGYYQNTMLVITLVVSRHSVLHTDRPPFLTGYIYTWLEIVPNVTIASNFICIILH